MVRYINFFGDFVPYEKLSIEEYEQKGGVFTSENNSLYKYDFDFVIHIPFNKGYDDKKLIQHLVPNKKTTFQANTGMWLISRFII